MVTEKKCLILSAEAQKKERQPVAWLQTRLPQSDKIFLEKGIIVECLFFSVLLWRHACMRLEVAREGCLLGEAKLVADLLNGEFRMVAEHGFCLYDDVLRYPLADADACGLTDDGAEVFGC